MSETEERRPDVQSHRPDHVPMPETVLETTLAVMSSTLLGIMRTLGDVEERLGHIESLVGMNATPVWEGEMGGRSPSVLQRHWDPVAQRWIYLPDPQ